MILRRRRYWTTRESTLLMSRSLDTIALRRVRGCSGLSLSCTRRLWLNYRHLYPRNDLRDSGSHSMSRWILIILQMLTPQHPLGETRNGGDWQADCIWPRSIRTLAVWRWWRHPIVGVALVRNFPHAVSSSILQRPRRKGSEMHPCSRRILRNRSRPVQHELRARSRLRIWFINRHDRLHVLADVRDA
jgi:hypothetical protein